MYVISSANSLLQHLIHFQYFYIFLAVPKRTNECTISVVAIPVQHAAETDRAESSAVKLTAFNQPTSPPSPVDNNS